MWAATYDLIIKGGRVIDPSVGLDAVRDVAIAAAGSSAVEASIAGDATETIDARGKIVAPGLIDIHTHAGRSKEGPPMCLQDGVTGWVDAGSGGADNIDQDGRRRARRAANRPRAGQHRADRRSRRAASCTTSTTPMSALAQGAIARHRDVVVGVKARLSDRCRRRQRS